MKRIVQLRLLVFALLLCFNTESYAQYGYGKKKKKKKEKVEKNDEYFDESGGFGHRLWYGGGFNLGFTGNNFRSLFQIGISPMVGYKIFDELSVGPRVSLQYNHFRLNLGGGNIEKANATSWGLGAFARYKVFQNFFAHAEYEYENAVGFFLGNNEIITVREKLNNYYLGAGYNSGNGIFGYEIYLLYNFNEREDTTNIPIDFRIGFTYNF